MKDKMTEAERMRLQADAKASRLAASVAVTGSEMTPRGEEREDRPTGATPEREYVARARGTRSAQD